MIYPHSQSTLLTLKDGPNAQCICGLWSRLNMNDGLTQKANLYRYRIASVKVSQSDLLNLDYHEKPPQFSTHLRMNIKHHFGQSPRKLSVFILHTS